MAPRALTDKEKRDQRDKLMNSGKELVFKQGIRKTSIDDIVKKTGVAKGTFYNYFSSREEFFVQMIWDYHQYFISQARELIKASDCESLPGVIRQFIISLFTDEKMSFFFSNHHEMEELLFAFSKEEDKESLNNMEYQAFKELLELADIDTEKVRPGVVHNYIHAIYFTLGPDLMIASDIEETLRIMLDSLMDYIFGGNK